LLQSEVPELESNTRSEYAGVLETVFQTLYGLGPLRTFYITKNILLDMGRAKPFVHSGRLESIKVRNYVHKCATHTSIHLSLGTVHKRNEVVGSEDTLREVLDGFLVGLNSIESTRRTT